MSVDAVYQDLRARLPRRGAGCGTAHQGRVRADEINRLKVERNAQ